MILYLFICLVSSFVLIGLMLSCIIMTFFFCILETYIVCYVIQTMFDFLNSCLSIVDFFGLLHRFFAF
jgi:hypothetical protein